MAGRRANYHWETVPAALASYVFAETGVSSKSFLDLGTFLRSGTIRRMIVDVYVQLNNLVDTQAAAGRVGIIVARPATVAAGAAAVSGPITSGEVEWLWNRAYAMKSELVTSGVDFIPLHLHDDVRGMRKYKENDHLIFVVENGPASAIDTMCSVRFLEST